MRVGQAFCSETTGVGLGGVVSGGVVCVTLLLGAERWPLRLTVTIVYVVVRPGQSLVMENVVFGGSTRMQPSPFLTTQYHQFEEPPLCVRWPDSSSERVPSPSLRKEGEDRG